MPAQTFEIADFASIVETPGQPRTWIPAQFPAPEGGMWVYQEPDAVIVVQDGRLRVAAVPFTRGHDRVQVLDNAKHMYFSTRTFEAAARGRLTVEWEMSASMYLPTFLAIVGVSFLLLASLALGSEVSLSVRSFDEELDQELARKRS